MNTRQKRLVATLFFALAALASMGFVADEDRNVESFTADHLTCPAAPSTSIYLAPLNPVVEHCFPAAAGQVETEIDRGFGTVTSASTEALIESIYTNARERVDVTLDEPRTEAHRRTGFDGPLAEDVPLVSVYTHN